MKDNKKTDENEKLKKALNEHSFKVKPIFLELPNYTYYHSAMERKDEDPNKRFIGRKKIIDKLRSFIFESKTNTGTYLVSGFRGMGKTSVVNEALSILKPKSNILKFIQLWFLLLLLLLIPKEFYDTIKDEFIFRATLREILGIVIVLLWILLLKIYYRKSAYYSRKNWFRFFRRSLININELSKTKFAFLNILFKLLLFLSLSYLLLLIWSFWEFTLPEKFWFVFGFVMFLHLCLRTYSTYTIYSKKKKSQIAFLFIVFALVFVILSDLNPKMIIFLINGYLVIFLFYLLYLIQKRSKKNYFSSISIIKSYFDLKQHIVIKINLGKDNLVEKDVLKFIVNELYYEYKRWYTNYKNEKRFVNIFALSLFLLGIIKIAFTVLPEDIIQDEINSTYGISDFFPSQELLSYEFKDQIKYDNLESLQQYTDLLAFYTAETSLKPVKEDTIINLEHKKIISSLKYFNHFEKDWNNKDLERKELNRIIKTVLHDLIDERSCIKNTSPHQSKNDNISNNSIKHNKNQSSNQNSSINHKYSRNDSIELGFQKYIKNLERTKFNIILKAAKNEISIQRNCSNHNKLIVEKIDSISNILNTEENAIVGLQKKIYQDFKREVVRKEVQGKILEKIKLEGFAFKDSLIQLQALKIDSVFQCQGNKLLNQDDLPYSLCEDENLRDYFIRFGYQNYFLNLFDSNFEEKTLSNCPKNLNHPLQLRDNLVECGYLDYKWILMEIGRNLDTTNITINSKQDSLNVVFNKWTINVLDSIFVYLKNGINTNAQSKFLSILKENNQLGDSIIDYGYQNNKDTSRRKDLFGIVKSLLKVLEGQGLNYQDSIYEPTTQMSDSIFKYLNYEKLSQSTFLRALKENEKLRSYFIEYGYQNYEEDKGKFEHIKHLMAKTLNGIDFTITSYWTKIRRGIIPSRFLSTKKNKFERQTTITLIEFFYPPVPNFIVFSIFFLCLIIFKYLPGRFKPFTSHTCIINDLQTLKEEINYSIQFDKNAGAVSGRNSIFSIRKSSRRNPLDSKDITQRLIHLLAKVDSIRSIFIRVKLIFIFDELDKIEANHNESLSSKENEFETKDKNERYNTRRRERIGNILSSMKHFLNSAKAKFIFIAGREMYDASLAGISDRESSLDSIFNDNKIYVESFYLEGHDGKLSDISSMTETYICQFLIPPKFIDDYNNKKEQGEIQEVASLKMYNAFLKSKGNLNHIPTETPTETKEREKIIITLKDFIVYLTYRSNGAPRKLSNIFEQHIEKFDKYALFEGSCNTKIVKGNNDNNLYLKLSYYDQYKVSVISYLLTPIIYQLGNHIHEYSDKLLVSISYMLDHIFKHHKYGLSFRSLALTPEIVDVNKEPEFRNFLERFINTMSASHLRPIVSGIYDYKFHSKVATEFTFLSKINEQETAAFNFTQDETIELKRHFNKRLDLLRGQGKTSYLQKDVYEDYVNSEAFLHMMIGDLHYNDSQFSDAILNYMNALHTIRRQSVSKMYLYDFVLMVRNKLKLGLAFEKNKMSDNAFMTYSELSDLILRKRNVSLKEVGLCRFVIKNYNDISLLSSSNPKLVDRKIIKKIRSKLDLGVYNEVIVIGRPKSTIIQDVLFKWEDIQEINQMETYYADSESDLIKNFDKIDINYKSSKWNYIFSTLENIRLLYQPIIAKLHLIEKVGPSKLGKTDIEKAIKEFDYLRAPLDKKHKRIITAEFYNKLGDIMFFRNGSLFRESDSIDDLIELRPYDALGFYFMAFEKLLNIKRNLSLIDFKTSRIFYGKVTIILKKVLDFEINVSVSKKYSYGFMNSLANIYVDLAGSLLCFIDSDKLGVLDNKVFKKKQKLNTSQVTVIDVICIYSKAAQLYNRMGEHRLAKSQYIKIFHLIRENYNDGIVGNVVDRIDGVNDFENLLNKSIELCYKVNGQANHIELHKVEEIFNDKITTKQASTLKADVDELLYLYWMIKLKGVVSQDEKTRVVNFVYNNTNPYSVPRKKHNRILELILRLSINDKLFKGFDFELGKNYIYYPNIRGKEINLNFKLELIKCKPLNFIDPKINKHKFSYKPEFLIELICAQLGSKELKEWKIFLIIDSLGVCNELLKLHDLLGVNYVTTNQRVLASCHYKMYEWTSRWKGLSDIRKGSKRKSDLEGILKSTLNSETLMYMNEKQSLGLSNSYLDKVIDFHTRGKTLYSFLQNCSYLDDFYNDSMVHFSIALERSYLIKNYDRLSKPLKERASSKLHGEQIEEDLTVDFKDYYK